MFPVSLARRVFADLSARLQDGRSIFTDAFDRGTSNSTTMYPITKRITAEEIKGKSIDEVEAIAKGE